MNNFYEALVEYFNTTSKTQILEDWEKSKIFDSIGPTVEEFLTNTKMENIKETIKSQLLEHVNKQAKEGSPFIDAVIDFIMKNYNVKGEPHVIETNTGKV
jgi:hypothetical protein